MWTAYSTRQAAEFVGLTESAVRSCVRAGVLSTDSSTIPHRFSFRDLLVLKVVKKLVAAGVSPRRIRRQLSELRQRLPQQTSLAELTITCHDGHVVVRDDKQAWRASDGQMLFPFSVEEPPETNQVTPIPVRRVTAAPEPVVGWTADEWFDRALELEEEDPIAAIAAYQRALRLRPDCTETLINMGRLHAENGEPETAAAAFRRALELQPEDPTALYNLGVVAQDAGDDDDAIELYKRALHIDPSLCEAHYNLATIFDRTGDARSAIRHINEYRKLTRNVPK